MPLVAAPTEHKNTQRGCRRVISSR